ncbi:acyltransferase [Leptospira ellinghausenii]|uniref:Acyltransferase n=1 Tax=Leptospira ellinghausenii TaxID=1917822 RepID=A0A2P2D848_9LEPT|nr:acyltransferase family protein [Leptospira ellinghausenii]GBF40778.1 acyltransferase [Leptospira ellinghausenii]
MGRLIYLDNLRSFALLLGIVFHSAIVYASDIKYAIQTEERSEILSYFCYWIHSFRMPMFYMISGFFSAMVIEKKGTSFYLDGRLRRVFIPTIFGLVFLAPIQYFLMEKLNSPNLSLLEFLTLFFTKDKFQHSHIWFLVDLFLFSMIYVLIQKPLNRFANWKPFNALHGKLFYLIGISFFLVLLAHTQFGKGESVYGIFKLTFVYQFVFFIVGVFCFFWKEILFVIYVPKLKPYAILVWAILVSLLLMELEISDPLWIYFSYANPMFRIFHIFLWVLSPFLWTVFFVFAFVQFGNEEGKMGTYIIEASLPIYLLHHPISLIYAYIMKDSPYPIWGKFLFHNLFVLALSFLLYEILIKRTRSLRFIFGLKVN